MLTIHHAVPGPGLGISREDEHERRKLVKMSYPRNEEGLGPRRTLPWMSNLIGLYP